MLTVVYQKRVPNQYCSSSHDQKKTISLRLAKAAESSIVYPPSPFMASQRKVAKWRRAIYKWRLVDYINSHMPRNACLRKPNHHCYSPPPLFGNWSGIFNVVPLCSLLLAVNIWYITRVINLRRFVDKGKEKPRKDGS